VQQLISVLHQVMAGVDVLDAIRRRALQVGRLGEYLGLFDLACWAWMSRRVVLVWFAGRAIDILSFFLPAIRAEAAGPSLHLVASRVNRVTTGVVHEASQTNHWLAAAPFVDADVVVVIPDDSSVADDFWVILKEERLVVDDDLTDITDLYRRLGIQVNRTQMQGDCGVDAILACEGLARTSITWQELRAKLMNFMWEHAPEVELQELWGKCGENVHTLVADSGISPELADFDVQPDVRASDSFLDEFAVAWGAVKPSLATELVARFCPERLDALKTDLALARRQVKITASAKGGHLKFGQQVRASLQVRLAMGIAFNAFKEHLLTETTSKKRVDHVKEFCKTHMAVAWEAKVKKRVRDAGMLATRSGLSLGARAIGRPRIMMEKIDSKLRKNALSTQGRPFTAVALRESLFAWFCDIRGSVLGRLSQRVVLAQAQILMSTYVQNMLATGNVPRTPKLDLLWLYRWRKHYGVSFRSPNRRYKISYRGLLCRLEIFWLNNIRVRHFAMKMLLLDPGRHVDCADQKGWHMNQAGSRLVNTLSLAGVAEVPLKENHGDTRSRLTLMTFTSNNLNHIKAGLPLEICFKVDGTGERVLEGLQVPPGAFSVRCSDSGSYREEHVYLYLQLHLPLATPERRTVKDWRLFYLDIYSGHLSFRIWQLCWDRMYVLLYHGGGCTGLTQPNDLWLHWQMERTIGHLESLSFLRQQLMRPNKIPTLSRQEVLDNAAAAWLRDLPHERSVKWTRMAGMSLALDGSEDSFSLPEILFGLLCIVSSIGDPWCVGCGEGVVGVVGVGGVRRGGGGRFGAGCVEAGVWWGRLCEEGWRVQVGWASCC
jgi:hypothetical protein